MTTILLPLLILASKIIEIHLWWVDSMPQSPVTSFMVMGEGVAEAPLSDLWVAFMVVWPSNQCPVEFSNFCSSYPMSIQLPDWSTAQKHWYFLSCTEPWLIHRLWCKYIENRVKTLKREQVPLPEVKSS